MPPTPRSAFVVGGGVIGSTTAYRLARAGWGVTLFDPTPGQGATWAAAGMIAPAAEIAPGEEKNFALQCSALASWRTLGAELEEIAGLALYVNSSGTLLLGFDASDLRQLRQFESVASRVNVIARHVTSDDAAMFAGVSPRIREGLFLERDGWIDPDEAMKLLRTAGDILGVRIVRESVDRVSAGNDYVEVTTASDSFRASIGVLATGAAPPPAGLVGRARNTVRPVRGMTVRIHGLDRSDQPTIRAIVRGRASYLVSRPGGYCVLGASLEEQASPGVEVGELQRLLRDALDVIPSLEGASVIETRQGFRPASANLAPFLEVLDERWAWLSGHYRHGVTLAPTASLIALDFAQALQ